LKEEVVAVAAVDVVVAAAAETTEEEVVDVADSRDVPHPCHHSAVDHQMDC
jgi:hypothetical protein